MLIVGTFCVFVYLTAWFLIAGAGGPALECVHCGAISVDGCGPKGPCLGRRPITQSSAVSPRLEDKPNDILMMEALVELIDWAGPPNMRGRVLDGMQVELERRVAVAKAGAR